jgi:hypothetical protein
MIARWWQSQQHTSTDRTPLARMLPTVIGGPAWDRGREISVTFNHELPAGRAEVL